MKPQRCTMSNGCELVYRKIDDGSGGVPLVFWGGVFGTHLIWASLAKQLRQSHPLVIIDYPDIGLNRRFFEKTPLSIEMLAMFQKEIMAQFDIERAVVVGWSFGTQVAMAFTAMNEEQVLGIVAMSGVVGEPFKHISDPIYERIGIRPTVSQTVGWLSKQEETISRLRRLLRKNEHPSRWAKRLSLVSPSVDELVMDAVVRDFVRMEPRHYNEYLQAAASYSARSVVAEGNIPILAISGDQDKLVPAKRTREFVKKNSSDMLASEFLLVKGGTHFLPLEYPKLIALKVEDFLRKLKTFSGRIA